MVSGGTGGFESRAMSECRSCGTPLTGRFCKVCGLDSQCPTCGNRSVGQFCGFCGSSTPFVAGKARADDLGHRPSKYFGRAAVIVFVCVAGAVIMGIAIAVAVGARNGSSSSSTGGDVAPPASQAITSPPPPMSPSSTSTSPSTGRNNSRPIYQSVTPREFGDASALAVLRTAIPSASGLPMCTNDCSEYADHQSWAVDEWISYCGASPAPMAGIRGRMIHPTFTNPAPDSDTATPYLFVFATSSGAVDFAKSIGAHKQCLEGMVLAQLQLDASTSGNVVPSSIKVTSTYFPSISGYPYPTSRLAFTVSLQLLTGDLITALDAFDIGVAEPVVAVVDQFTLSGNLNASYGHAIMLQMQGG